jgi:hypothetical protein
MLSASPPVFAKDKSEPTMFWRGFGHRGGDFSETAVLLLIVPVLLAFDLRFGRMKMRCTFELDREFL